MRSNIPESSESPDTLIQAFIDPQEWAAAKWAATVFSYHLPRDMGGEPPGVGLAFENFDAGKKIFDGWIERLGHVDVHEELRLSIIEGPVPSEADGYTVFVSSNPLHTIARKQKLDPNFNPVRFIRLSQMNRMYPAPDSPHLRLFKIHFARVRRYRLFPAHFQGSEIKAVDSSSSIEKRELNLFNASDLKPEDLEYAAVTAQY